MMLKRKNIPMEESLKRACEANGFIYDNHRSSKKRTYITLVDEGGKETLVNKDLKVIKTPVSSSSLPVIMTGKVAKSLDAAKPVVIVAKPGGTVAKPGGTVAKPGGVITKAVSARVKGPGSRLKPSEARQGIQKKA